MKYIGVLNDDVIVAKGINYTDYIDENEIELTEIEYNNLQPPCKLVAGEYIPCEFPTYEGENTPIEEEKTSEEKISSLEKQLAVIQAEIDKLKE